MLRNVRKIRYNNKLDTVYYRLDNVYVTNFIYYYYILTASYY
jgi:hypothetical protein